MENETMLDLEWMPSGMDAIFEDAHADMDGQWESVQGQQQDTRAA